MEEQLVQIILSDAGALVVIGDRFWPAIAKQGADDVYAVYQAVSGTPDYSMGGATRYVQTRIQIDTYAATYGGAKLAARAIKSALSGYRAGIFQGIFLESERDLNDRNSTINSAERLYRISLDFMVHHTGD